MKAEIRFGSEGRVPSKIVCVGRNYVEHVQELGNEVPDEMVVFLKPNSAISDTLCSIHGGEPLHYEAEICFGVREGKFAYVGFGLDLTKRGLQSKLKGKGLPWERSKAFDGSAVFSEFVPIDDAFDSLEVQLRIDGKVAQKGGVSQMMFPPDSIFREVGRFCRLEDYDIVMTGTPKGVGELVSGSQYDGAIRRGDETLVSAEWRAR